MLSEAEQAELEALLRPLELPLEPLALLLDDDALALAPAPLLPPLASQLARAPESDESAASASAEAPTSALVHSGPRPARRASYKAQIAQARARASELERELEAARARASSRRQQQQQEMEKQQQEEEMEQQGEERLARKPRATGVWRTIAGRQARYREEAEAENAHLRKLVAAQARHLRNVVALAKRRPYRVVSGAERSAAPLTGSWRLTMLRHRRSTRRSGCTRASASRGRRRSATTVMTPSNSCCAACRPSSRRWRACARGCGCKNHRPRAAKCSRPARARCSTACSRP